MLESYFLVQIKKYFFIIVDPPHIHVYAMILFTVTSVFDFVIADQFYDK